MSKEKNTTEEAGFIKLIILVVIGLLVLRFLFEFDVIDYVSQEEFRNFASKVWSMVVIGWAFLINNFYIAWEVTKDVVLGAIEIVKEWVS